MWTDSHGCRDSEANEKPMRGDWERRKNAINTIRRNHGKNKATMTGSGRKVGRSVHEDRVAKGCGAKKEHTNRHMDDERRQQERKRDGRT